jgi:hypothetical protein
MPEGKRLCLKEPLTARAVVLLMLISAPEALLYKLKRDKAVPTEHSFWARNSGVVREAHITRSSAEEPGIGIPRKKERLINTNYERFNGFV